MKKLERLIKAEQRMTSKQFGDFPNFIHSLGVLILLPLAYVGIALIFGFLLLVITSFALELFSKGSGNFFFKEWRGSARGIILGSLLYYYITLTYNYFKVGKND